MDGERFREVIREGTEHYGGDDWFFLRELAQNSRDADASGIRIIAGYIGDNTEFIRFEDNGSGMSKAHAVKYLFKLYASSKENQREAIGKYGIGFWTILKFEPYEIIIESKTRGETWAVKLNEKLEAEEIKPTIIERGTKITLLRLAEFNNPEEYLNLINEKLKKFCKYLTVRKSFKKLPVYFNKSLINEEMKLEGEFVRNIKHKKLRGLIALGKKPSVKLYSKGLPIWEGLVLSDLTDNKDNRENEQKAEGLSPVFLLNSSGIDINLSRKLPIDNRELSKMIEVSEKELSKLIYEIIKKTSKNSPFKILMEKLRNLSYRIKNSFFLKTLLIIILLIPIEIIILNGIYNKKTEKITEKTKKQIDKTEKKDNGTRSLPNSENYSGATVSENTEKNNIDITYYPKDKGLFKLYSATKYDILKGFIYTKSEQVKDNIPKTVKISSGIRIRINGINKGNSFLPYKSGYIIDKENIKKYGNKKIIIKKFTDETVKIYSEEYIKSLEYAIYPLKIIKLKGNYIKRYTELPLKLKLPKSIADKIEPLKEKNIDEKIRAVSEIIRNLIRYSNNKKTARAYKSFYNLKWVDKVLKIGKGDCDVINGLNTLLLRKLKIPANLAIGYIGENGRMKSTMHAWTEYFNKGWKTIDLSYSQAIKQEIKKNLKTVAFNKNHLKKDRDYSKLFTVIILTLFPILFIFYRRRERKAETETVSLNNIAINALIYPDVWSSDYFIWNFRYIPSMSDKYISIREILQGVKKGKIYKSSRNNELLNKKNLKRLLVLDKDEPNFKEFIGKINGLIDLDKISDLQIKTVKEADIRIPDLKDLLIKTDKLLKDISKARLRIFFTKRGEDCFTNYKISKYIYPHSENFVLLSENCREISKYAENYRKNKELALYTFSKKILDTAETDNNEIRLFAKELSKILLKNK